MKCEALLLPLMAGLAFYAFTLNAKSPGSINHRSTSPLLFLENKGQIHNQYQVLRNDIDFSLSANNGLHIFIGSGKIEYQWAKSIGKPSQQASLLNPIAAATEEDIVYEMYRMDVQLIGANSNARVIKEIPQYYYERYYLLGIPDQGAVARSYQKITYKDIYPNIDWVFYFNNQGQLEHDFVVLSGGKVSDIKIRYGGASNLQLLPDGGLQAHTPMGTIKEKAPYSYDEQGRVVASHFTLEGNILSFAVAEHTGTLTIDPTLEWSTYFGGTGVDQAFMMQQDGQGFMYLTGAANSTANIATTGAYQTTFGNGARDVFITKMDTTGHPVWSTYYGGTGDDRGMDVAISPSGAHIYIGGYTNSNAGISTSGAHQSTLGGNFDALLVKFDTAGQRIWASYYGGTAQDGNSALGLTCDKDENIYLCGSTLSTTNISSTSGYQAAKSGNMDGFIAKFNPAGQRLWGTYYGGSGNDYTKRVCTDSLGHVYMIGNTLSNSGMATSTAQQVAYGGEQDGFITAFKPDGQLSWATYYGGSQAEDLYSVGIHTDGDLYIGGVSASTSGISTTGSYQRVYGGGTYDGFIARFNRGGKLNWASYYGGEETDIISSITPTPGGGLALIGHTLSTTGIASLGYYRDTLFSSLGYDLFFALFDAEGQRKNSSYYGGIGADIGVRILMDDHYHLYLLGNTNSATTISTPNSYQSTFGGGGYDAFLLKMNTCEVPPSPLTMLGDTVICAGSKQWYSLDTLSGALSYAWQLPDGWSGESDSSRIQVLAGSESGVLSVRYRNYCAQSDPLAVSISVNPLPKPTVRLDGKILRTTQSYAHYQWLRNGLDIIGATDPTYVVAENGEYAVRVMDTAGCEGSSEFVEVSGTSIAPLPDDNSGIRIYPNPARDQLYIFALPAAKVSISGVDGRLVLESGYPKVMDLRSLSPGLYIARLYDREGQLLHAQKLVKQ